MARLKKFRGLLIVLAVLIGAWRYASIDRCGEWPMKQPALSSLAQSQGALTVGASFVPFTLQFPTTVGGYPPLRASVDKALTRLGARAVVIEAGNQRVTLVVLDVLLVPPQLRDAIAANQKGPVWTIATHTHTGPSGYDPRSASEWAALGTFDQKDQDRLAEAARKAIESANASMQSAKLEVGEGANELAVPRSGTQVDRRITRARFDGANGPIAQLLILAGHPTLEPRKPEGLHGDWPALLAQRLEVNGGPVTLVMQGAGGNASVNRDVASTPELAAQQLENVVKNIVTIPQPEPVSAAWNEVRVSLPRPEAKRIAPGPFVEIAENALCDDAEDVVLLHGLRLGELSLLFVPLEPSANAGLVLEEQARVGRLVSLADGYSGYVETLEVARAGGGESQRQYFSSELISSLAEGAKLVGDAMKAPAPR
ncbi:MAG: neutral/alkaline non-lysosomal ceramidase N-terminal domain-containing protein [Archangium sp.]